MNPLPLIQFTEKGFYCAPADVYIDPWKAVPNAMITHAHADHARSGMGLYISHPLTIAILQHRISKKIQSQTVEYGEVLEKNGVKFSFHPAGHVMGSAMIRVEYQGEIWVLSGDYKMQDDGFTPIGDVPKCQHFITESTFGLPIFDWQPQQQIVDDITKWHEFNASTGQHSVILGYSLGKAQRLAYQLRHLNVFEHPVIHAMHTHMRLFGIPVPEHPLASKEAIKASGQPAMIIAPPGVSGTDWLNQFEPYSLGNASGWMALRGNRRRINADRGFAMSDHADWKGLLDAVKQSEAEHIYVTHGYSDTFAKYLREKGWDAREVKTQYAVEEE